MISILQRKIYSKSWTTKFNKAQSLGLRRDPDFKSKSTRTKQGLAV